MIALVFAFFGATMAQEPFSNTGEHYTIGSLEKLGKLELTEIYVAQIQKLNMLLPYVPFNQKGEAVSLSGMGIPSTKDNNEAIKKLDESGAAHNEKIKETMVNVIPYSDKEDIIKAILFIQNITERMESGL